MKRRGLPRATSFRAYHLPMPTHDPQHMRRRYELKQLNEADLAPDPITQFRAWFDEAVQVNPGQWFEPNAMQLATVGQDGRPTTRTVLLKEIEDDALVFYTNYQSKKGHDIEAHPTAAATFYWATLERQVNLTGTASKVSREQSETYFRKRPRENQLGALASAQSAIVPDRAQLEAQLTALEAEHAGHNIPLPEYWGGYRITIQTMEFWQGGAGRLHDRLRYRREAASSSWVIERLSP